MSNVAEELQKLGGAQVILATAPSSKAMSEVINGLGPNGKLMVVGAAFEPIEVTPVQLVTGSRSIQGWASGTPADEEDTLRFAELTGVRPIIETYPLEKAAEAYARMMSGQAQFRVVLTMWTPFCKLGISSIQGTTASVGAVCLRTTPITRSRRRLQTERISRPYQRSHR
jgi:D-arabinose 1-dehydrogenase-like Zn-dependent alcohol dehydrogenase